MIDLEAIKARCEAATPGPWEHVGMGDIVTPTFVIQTTDRNRWDARFIAHARTDVPALVAEVERLRAEVEGLTDAYDALKSDADAVVGGLKLDYADCESVAMEWMRRARRAEALLEGVRRPELSAPSFRVDL